MNDLSFDLLLCGGEVIDPASGLQAKADVAIRDSVIIAVKSGLNKTARRVIDVSGCIVTPGLIDMHCHCYPAFPFAADTLPTLHPDAHMFQQGVTTAVDAGTCGPEDFPAFYRDVLLTSQVRTLAFLNIADRGMVHMSGEDDPSRLHPRLVAEVAEEYASHIVGIKSAHYWVNKPFDAAHPPWHSIDAALDAAQRCNLPCMVDFQPTPPERTYRKLLFEHLRPGDIHTHMYAQQFPVLDAQGRVQEYLFQARKRGIRFDLGHGAGSFWFRNAVPAVRQGFLPDTLSTDLYLDNVAGPVIGLTHVMSKFLNMGLTLAQVVALTTTAPAALLCRPELGTLVPGSCADIAVLRVEHRNVHFADSGRARMAGSRILHCAMTLRAGRVVYDPYALSMPDWEQAPEPYWHAPGVLP